MTLRAWLRNRSPAPPPRLSARVESTLGSSADRDVAEAPEICIAAAEMLLSELLSKDVTDRSSALDLLTIDALVTYAFEAAADSPDSVARYAADAMSRLAAAAR